MLSKRSSYKPPGNICETLNLALQFIQNQSESYDRAPTEDNLPGGGSLPLSDWHKWKPPYVCRGTAERKILTAFFKANDFTLSRNVREQLDYLAQFSFPGKIHWNYTADFDALLGALVELKNLKAVPGRPKTLEELWNGNAAYMDNLPKIQRCESALQVLLRNFYRALIFLTSYLSLPFRLDSAKGRSWSHHEMTGHALNMQMISFREIFTKCSATRSDSHLTENILNALNYIINDSAYQAKWGIEAKDCILKTLPPDLYKIIGGYSRES
jgi:hypothetical protein